MNVRKMSKDELELLSFTDIAYYIIKLDQESKTTVNLFKEICSLLELSDQEYEDKIADFFTSLTTDKRFILLNSINWDLREKNQTIEEEEEEDEDMDEIEDIDEVLDEEEEEDEDNYNDDEEIEEIDEEIDEEIEE